MRQVIAIGGGSFYVTPQDSSFDQYILAHADKKHPKVCFIPTASGDDKNYILGFYEAFSLLNCSLSYLSLFQLPTADLESFILEKDIVYVGGGNTRSMLALWHEWKLDSILRKAYEQGILLVGVSAGANCWFEQCTTDSTPGEIRILKCLGFLGGSFCPHYDEVERRPRLHKLIKEKKILPGFAADNHAAIHFINEKPSRALRSRPTANAYQLDCVGEKTVERRINMYDVSEAIKYPK